MKFHLPIPGTITFLFKNNDCIHCRMYLIYLNPFYFSLHNLSSLIPSLSPLPICETFWPPSPTCGGPESLSFQVALPHLGWGAQLHRLSFGSFGDTFGSTDSGVQWAAVKQRAWLIHRDRVLRTVSPPHSWYMESAWVSNGLKNKTRTLNCHILELNTIAHVRREGINYACLFSIKYE